jgi:hypothetical protein
LSPNSDPGSRTNPPEEASDPAFRPSESRAQLRPQQVS